MNFKEGGLTSAHKVTILRLGSRMVTRTQLVLCGMRWVFLFLRKGSKFCTEVIVLASKLATRHFCSTSLGDLGISSWDDYLLTQKWGISSSQNPKIKIASKRSANSPQKLYFVCPNSIWPRIFIDCVKKNFFYTGCATLRPPSLSPLVAEWCNGSQNECFGRFHSIHGFLIFHITREKYRFDDRVWWLANSRKKLFWRST